MGLDVTAYGKTIHIETLNDVEEYEERYHDWLTHHFVSNCYLNDDWCFSDWAEDLKPGVYRISNEKLHSFRAGSYSWYNSWREWLCGTALGVAPKEIWDNPDAYKNKPFFGLINFSDCEGYIGSKFSKELAADFSAYQEIVDTLSCDEWYKQQYANWRKAFELAANGGFVYFH